MTSLQTDLPRHRRPTPLLRIAMLGTRGVAPAYGGFETAVEEVGRRLVGAGHDVTVYNRSTGARAPKEHLGLRVVTLPALRGGSIETVSHTALAAAHLSASRRFDVAFVFNAANAPLVPLVRSRGTAVALHVDGFEWQRETRGRTAQRFHRHAEEVAVRQADAVVVDAQQVQDYYDDEFGIPTELIRYGATIIRNSPSDLIEGIGLVPGHYHLVVARFEPDNHVDTIVEGYHRSGARLPLVVVGSARYAADATGVDRVAASDPRIRLLGAVQDQRLLDQLYAHALGYLHGRSVGGTSPSLLRAMGASTAVMSWDGPCNREVVGTAGLYFRTGAEVARQVEEVERYPFRFHDIGELMQERARKRYDWDLVTESYEALAAKLARGYSTRDMSSGRRLGPAYREVSRTSRS